MNVEQNLLLEKSREFAQRVLIDGVIEGSMEKYCIFVVGKFMLMKELIEKNNTGKAITFYAEENELLIPAIEEIAKHIKEKNTLLIMNLKGTTPNQNSIAVNIVPKKLETSDLKEAIWIINTIRDSIMQGYYYINFKKSSIIIENDENMLDGFALVCEIPISLLAMLFHNNLSIEQLNELQNTVLLTNTKIKLSSDDDSITLDKLLRSIKLNSKKIQSLYTYGTKTLTLPQTTRNKILKLTSQCYSKGLLNSKKINNEKFKDLEYTKTYNITLDKLIEEMQSILKKYTNNPKPSISLIAMNNYMQNIFCLNDTKLNDNLFLIEINKINTKKLDIKKYDVLTNELLSTIQEYTKFIKQVIPNSKSKSQLIAVKKATIKFYLEIIKILNERNSLVLTSIKNNFEKSIISEEKDKVVTRNKSTKSNFEYSESYENLYELVVSMDLIGNLSPKQLERQKQEFIDKKIVDIISIDNKKISSDLFECINIVKTNLSKIKETIRVEDLIKSNKNKNIIDLKSIFSFNKKIESKRSKRL